MIKLYYLLLVLMIAPATYAQELTIGQKLPEIEFETMIQPESPGKLQAHVSVDKYKGKIILLDFWATWCGPCISAMKKYEDLSKKFPGKLQVIAITKEPVKRIQSFVKNRPTQLLIAIDTLGSISQYFPYRTIPHVVLIDKSGTIRAITHSDEITESVINAVWNDQTISLTHKKDDTKFDYDDDYFKVDSLVVRTFNIQPGIVGIGTFSKTGKGIFENRRISMHNFSVEGFYRMAFQKSYFRMISELNKEQSDYADAKNKFCLDVIVPKGEENTLYTFFQSKLIESFKVEAVLEKRKTSVYVVKRINDSLLLKPSQEKNDLYGASSNFFNGNGVSASAIADFMESFGLTGTPVVDETGLKGRYDINMEWEPEKKGSFREALAKIGLGFEKVEREIEVLILKTKPN